MRSDGLPHTYLHRIAIGRSTSNGDACRPCCSHLRRIEKGGREGEGSRCGGGGREERGGTPHARTHARRHRQADREGGDRDKGGGGGREGRKGGKERGGREGREGQTDT